MISWSFRDRDPIKRWGIVFIVVGLGFEVLVRQVNDVTLFVLDVLALVVGGFLGPLVVYLSGRALRTEFHGLMLGLLTFVACGLVALAVGLFFRAVVN